MPDPISKSSELLKSQSQPVDKRREHRLTIGRAGFVIELFAEARPAMRARPRATGLAERRLRDLPVSS